MPASTGHPRILIALPTPPAPSETWVYHHLRLARECGYSVVVAVGAEGTVEPKLRDCVEAVAFVPPCPAPLVARVAFVARKLANTPRRDTALSRTLRPGLFGKRLGSLAMFRWALAIRELPPADLVHCHYLFTAEILGGLRRCGFLTAPVIGTAHGFDLNVWPKSQPASVFPGFLPSVDVLTFGSQSMIDRFRAHNIAGPRLELLPLGIDGQRFENLQPRRNAGSDVMVLSVARLIPMKGLDVGIRAAAGLLLRFPEARYVIAGDGPERRKLEELAAELGVGRQVQFVGMRTEDELTALYAEADIFLFPSLTGADGACEGQGLALLEAQAAGMPVVASRSGGIPENLAPDRSGFLVAEGDVAAMSERLLYFAERPGLRTAFGETGRSFALGTRTLENQQRKLATLYRGLLPPEVRP